MAGKQERELGGAREREAQSIWDGVTIGELGVSHRRFDFRPSFVSQRLQ